jgi:FkbM family methyltransferase
MLALTNKLAPTGIVRSLRSRARRFLMRREERFNSFFKQSRGVIHVGANTGQERHYYRRLKLPVVWIEAEPAAFDELQRNIADCQQQRAFRYLITDKDGEKYTFHVASNDAASSSIFDMRTVSDIWPHVHYTHSVQLSSVTLATVMSREKIDQAAYDTLVLDTQGSELMILRGADLSPFRFIKTEAADFELYRNGALLADIDAYLASHGFSRAQNLVFARHPTGGVCLDVLYERR